MSLVSTFVQSTSGRWYKNPVIRGADFFVCWDDDDPIELVVHDFGGRTARDVLAELNEAGWDVAFYSARSERGRRMERMVGGGPVHLRRFMPSRAHFLRQKRGPTDELLAGNEPLQHGLRGVWQGVMYYDHFNGWKPKDGAGQ